MCSELKIGYDSNEPWAHRSQWERARWIAFVNLRPTIDLYYQIQTDLEAEDISIEEFRAWGVEKQRSAAEMVQIPELKSVLKTKIREWVTYDKDLKKMKVDMAAKAAQMGA